MKVTQLQVRQTNQAVGDEARLQAQALKELYDSDKARFLSTQQDKIRAQHQQLADTAQAVKTMTATKRSNNNSQRSSYARTWYRELKKERAYTEKGRERVISERAMNTEKRTARKELMQQKNNAAAMKAKAERMERRAHEHDKEKKQEIARKEHTARVRHETRPEVRKAGRDFFQNQRDARETRSAPITTKVGTRSPGGKQISFEITPHCAMSRTASTKERRQLVAS